MPIENRKDNIRVGIVGLGFGREFIPIYQKYRNSDVVAICKRNKKELEKIGGEFRVEKLYTSYEKILKDKDIDAIHIVTPILDHAWMTIQALEAGKHCACTVPMATSITELERIVEAKNRSKKIYMMMETAVYTREFIYVENLLKNGKIGKVQFLRGAHTQNMGMEGWPDYWKGFPPMWYGTHAVSPLSCLINKRFESVVCHGSGRISEERKSNYGSPFAVETATFSFEDSKVAAEATRSLFEVIRQYRESFDVYGDEMSFEWEQIADEGAVLFEGIEGVRRIEIPDTDYLLPDEIAPFTLREEVVDTEHVSFIQGAGHGGSHPHMVKEFVDSIVQEREPRENVITSANWTAAGICAHKSAKRNGERVYVPDFRDIL